MLPLPWLWGVLIVCFVTNARGSRGKAYALRCLFPCWHMLHALLEKCLPGRLRFSQTLGPRAALSHQVLANGAREPWDSL